MNHNMGTHPISINDTSQASTNHVSQSSVLTSMPNQTAAYLAFQNHTADSYNGQFAVFDSKPSYMPHVSKEAHLYDSHCGLYGLQSPTNMSPSPPPPPRVYKPCVVCNDKSSGYHYGVSSCEGCKGFFRRSVQKNMQYTCHKDKHCPINKVTRNRCQYCRLQKCFASGMSKEAVRNDRNKKRKVKPESASSSSEDLTGDDQNLIQDILDAHRATLVSEQDENSSSPSSDIKEEKESVILWEKISELSSDGVVKIVDFAKKIPGFSTLSQSDQITLLKAACLEIMILRLSARYDVGSDTLVFANGVSLDKNQLQEGGFGALTGTIFSFAASLKAMNIDEAEFAILSAICLISGDRSGLQDTEKIEQMQEPLLEALKHYTRSRRQDQPHIFAKLLMKLTDLRSISVKGEKQTLRFALDHLANALSVLEAPASNDPSIKTEPYSDPLDEPSCSGISSTVNLPNYDPHSKALPQQQRPMERSTNSHTMGYGSQMPSSSFMGSSSSSPGLGTLPDSSIPSPLGLGLPPMQLSPNQISSVMASIESPSPSSLSGFPGETSPGMPNYLNGLSPTLSPNFTLAPSTVSSILTSPVSSPGVDRTGLALIHSSISDRNGQVTNTQNQQMVMTSQPNGSQINEMLHSNHMIATSQMSRPSDMNSMKVSYSGDQNNSYSSNCLSFMGLPPNLNAAQFSLSEAVGSSSSDHHTPLSKIIAGAMTDTMQI